MTEIKKNPYSSKGSITNYTDMVICEYDFDLSFTQQIQIQKIAERKEIRSFLLDVVHKVTKNPRLDENSPQTKKIKQYFSRIKRGVVYFSFENNHLDFINKNFSKMRALEITKHLFKHLPERKVSLSKQHKAMVKYIKAIKIKSIRGGKNVQGKYADIGDPTQFQIEMDYVAPSTYKDLVYLINKCDHYANYNEAKLTKEQKTNMSALKSYLNDSRFQILLNSAASPEYKQVMMSQFVKATYDKPDLTADELNAYITLCDLYGMELEAKKQITLLNEQIQTSVDDDDPKLKLTIVQAMTSKTKELDQIHVRQGNIQKSLSGDRTKRLENKIQLGQSLILFVEKWKEEEHRQQALKIAEARKIKLQEEKKLIESFDDYIAEVVGVHEDDILDV